MPSRIALGVTAGVLLGGTAGAVAGAKVASWTGGFVGGYGGIFCGMCVIGGLVGVLSRDELDSDRWEACLALVFGVFATAGAITGYWLATLGIPRFSPLAGFFVGMIFPGMIAGIIAIKVLANRADPAILTVLVFGPMGAGFGAWLGTALGAPGWVAAGLVVGSVVGASIGHAVNEHIDGIVYGTDPVARHHGDYRRW